jgi:Tol biopolymer transport system component
LRYARAAGLDEGLVLTAVWPLVEAVEVQEDSRISVEAVEVITATEAPCVIEDLPLNQEVEAPAVAQERFRWGRAAVAASAGVAAMLALLVLPQIPDAPSQRRTTDIANSSQAPTSAATASSPRQSGVAAEQVREPGASAAAQVSGRQPQAASPASDVVRPARGFTDPEVSWSTALASAGSAVFYKAQGPDAGPPGLVRTDSAGDNVLLRITRVVDDKARNFHARPSPDGTRIAFDSDRDGERGVYVANADGTDVRRVTGEGFAAIPSWSPDGKSLAVVRAEPDGPTVWNLWLVDLATGDMRRLTSHRSGQPWGGSWFPDGKRLVYSHADRLVVLDVDSGRERRYLSPRKGRRIRTPAVSPDGRRVMFQIQGDGAWLLDLRDGASRRILADPSAEEYTWSPDGRRVAYYSRQSGEWGVWLMAPG